MKIMKIFFALFFLFSYSASSQEISYIQPDIFAPGMSVTMEFIAPYGDGQNTKGSFGPDGLYFNKPGDDIKIVYVDQEDTNKVTFGPLLVSWGGRVVSTSVYISERMTPDSWDYTKVSSENVIPIRLEYKGNQSNIIFMYIVQPFSMGDISSLPDRELGAGSLGKRSASGVMIVDSITFADDIYTVSTDDNYNKTPGNQGYMPFYLYSMGSIRGGANTVLNVNAQGKHAGPGGGGGGGKYEDWPNGSGADGGNGFTGGGSGGRNGSGIFSDFKKKAGDGSGQAGVNGESIGGIGANGIPGGDSEEGNYEASGGGTGHPFGLSGRGCNGGATCTNPGGFGGGSGYQQNLKGGAAGFATDGLGNDHISGNTGGKTHGNIYLVPFCGGSGGASGNPKDKDDSYDGGGGGGAMYLYCQSIENLSLEAKGGWNKPNGGGNDVPGGEGSAGAIYISTIANSSGDLPSVDIIMENGGGQGRYRIDNFGTYSNFDNLPSQAVSKFAAVSLILDDYTDTLKNVVKLVNRSINYTINNIESKEVDLYYKGENTEWTLWKNYPSGVGSINDVIDLPKPDTTFYLMAITKNPGANKTDYLFEPDYTISNSAIHQLRIETLPELECTAEKEIEFIWCPGENDLIRDSILVENGGDAELFLGLDNVTISPNNLGFEYEGVTHPEMLKPGETYKLPIKYTADPSHPKEFTVTLTFAHNDIFLKNTWDVTYTIKRKEYLVESFNKDNIRIGSNIIENPLNLYSSCPGVRLQDTFKIINNSDIPITIKSVIPEDSRFKIAILDPTNLDLGEEARVEVSIQESLEGEYKGEIDIEIEECASANDKIYVVAEYKAADFSFSGNSDFDDVLVNTKRKRSFEFKNNSSYSVTVDSFRVKDYPQYFVASSSNLNNPLSPGASFDIDVEFMTDISGVYTDKLEVYTSWNTECSEMRNIDLIANAIDPDSVRIWFPDTSAKPIYTDFRVPLYGEVLSEDFYELDYSFRAKISFNAGLYNPKRLTYGDITHDTIIDGQRVMSIEVVDPYFAKGQNILTELEGTTYLSDENITYISIDEFEWISDENNYFVQPDSGRFEIIICTSGGSRLIKSLDGTHAIINPSPVESNEMNLEAYLNESGEYKLQILNQNGQIVLSKSIYNNEAGGKYKEKIDVSSLSSGFYILRLYTSFRYYHQAFMILK